MKLVLLIVAIILFVLAAVGIDSKWDFHLIPLGLAFFAAAFLPIPERLGT